MVLLPTALVLWLLYQSVVNVGQTWYSFGWESQLLETGPCSGGTAASLISQSLA